VIPIVAAIAILLTANRARADRLDTLSSELQSRDTKARINAAVQLGKLGDPRGVPPLIKALTDENTVVRGLAATALGHIGDARAIAPLEKAQSDRSEAVRSRARDALKALRAKASAAKTRTVDDTATTSTTVKPQVKTTTTTGGAAGKPRIFLVVKQMTNKSNAGAKELSKKMRDAVVHELERSTDCTLDSGVGTKLKQFTIDGTISKLTRGTSGPWMEVTAEVKLTISTAEGRMMSIVTGSATVQVPRGTFKLAMERNMQIEAVENAVRGAHQTLLGYLTRQVASK
jgi:hypothetical protein